MNNPPIDEVALKRLHFRSTHRGCKEMDLVLSAFAEHHLPGLNSAEIQAYGQLLDEPDADIWDWLMGRGRPARAEYAALLARMEGYCPTL